MVEIGPISTLSLADEAFSRLVEAIDSGEFMPGERLSESELARQLGISRGPLREALGRLEGRLVNRKPRHGVSIIEVTPQDLLQLFAIREALEGLACREASEKATPRQLDALEALLDRHGADDHVLNEHGYLQKTNDDDFHALVVDMAANDRLKRLLMQEIYYQVRFDRFRASRRPGRAAKAYAEHRDILQALKSRNATAAEEAMRLHIRNASESLVLSFDHPNTAQEPERNNR